MGQHVRNVCALNLQLPSGRVLIGSKAKKQTKISINPPKTQSFASSLHLQETRASAFNI